MKISKNLFPHFKEQIEVLEFLQDNILSKIPKEYKNYYAFGGGTALSLCYFQHRLSFDIDVFIYDNQLMNYINPSLYFEDIEEFIDDYIFMSHQINFVTKKGIYVNILSVNNLNIKKNIFLEISADKSILVETPEEIIAKKIIYRKKDNKVRDLFDIAFAIYKDKNFLKKLIEMKYINKNDLKDLYLAIQKVDEKEIEEELKIISPLKKIDNIILIIKKVLKIVTIRNNFNHCGNFSGKLQNRINRKYDNIGI